ncbi:MAG: SpoIID/LytB domain-containing protein [Candidatus Omnitrophota bacterium]
MPGPATADSEILRVCVIKDAEKLLLRVKGRYELYRLDKDVAAKEGKNLKNTEVIPVAGGLSIGGQEFGLRGVKIVPARSGAIYIDKRPFRGEVDIIKDASGRLLAINHIALGDYLKGVMRNEVSEWWPSEALKAQAIAARTYALYQKSIRGGRDYDVTSDIYSQVYGGRMSERWRTSKAIRHTRGQVLTYNGKILPAYYHATCGGHTEDAAFLWNVDLPPMKGHRSNFCKVSPHYKWTCDITVSEIERALNRGRYKIKNLKYMIMQGRNASGRLRSIKLVGDEEIEIPAGDFRLTLGPNLIKSTNFDIIDKGNYLQFRGKGWGHGVGMCQWGAYFLSKKRYRAEDILRFYYPGSEIRKIWAQPF